VNFFVENWSLFLLAAVSGGMLLWPVVSKGARAGSLSPTEAVMLMNREKAVLVDVCSEEEFAKGHVAQARHIPLADLEAKLPTAVKNKATPVILVCATGARSNRAVALAKRLGFENSHSLSGGMAAWREAGLPVQKS
jgi:rhodanese-related sulfurtransferase